MKYRSEFVALFRRWFLLVALITTLSCQTLLAYAGFEDRTYERQRIELGDLTEVILIKNGVCSSKIDCQKKQPFFISPAKTGVAMQIYGVSNLKAIEQIATACASAFFETGGHMNISIHVFRFTKQEDLNNFWRSTDPYLIIEFKGEK